mmetsp:Transcript_27406/g.65799  ORF Transcript_27406/g.65799 Transcript_27406/m.65799 type:complete len:335 (-) Transcript_27406:2160-3164(-)
MVRPIKSFGFIVFVSLSLTGRSAGAASSSSPSSSKSSSSSSRKAQQLLQSRVLDTVTTSAVGWLYYNYPDLFNPWDFTTVQWWAGALFIKVALTFFDYLVFWTVEYLFHSKLLPTRLQPDKPVRYVELDRTSMMYLTINAVHEWIFVQRMCHFIWFSPDVSLDIKDIGLMNTVGALWLMFIVMDLLYAPIHHLLHMPALYPLVHKHHHRQHFPTRGYLDAGNEHPIEHLVGVMCNWAAVLTAVHCLKAHAVVLFCFFNIHAVLAMLNHSPYDVTFNIIPYGILRYSVGSHEMHHRKFTVNYGQYSMLYDHAVKTFVPYEGPNQKKSVSPPPSRS